MAVAAGMFFILNVKTSTQLVPVRGLLCSVDGEMMIGGKTLR